MMTVKKLTDMKTVTKQKILNHKMIENITKSL